MTILLAITFSPIVFALFWAAWVVLNFWVFQKTKAVGNVLMLIGAAVSSFFSLLKGFDIKISGDEWLPIVGLLLVTLGFYFSVKPMVAAQMAQVKAKILPKPGAPPPPPPPHVPRM